MSFRSVLILFVILDVMSRSIAGLILLFWGSQTELPIIIYLFSGALVLYGLGLLIYDEFKTLSAMPLVIFFISESLIFIINLFIINYYFNKWYSVHLSALYLNVTGNFLDLLINIILIIYFFLRYRRPSGKS